MADARVSIGRVKRDISELVNRVAYGGRRIVLTSRGRPKAALVTIEDYERLRRLELADDLAPWAAWHADQQALAAQVRARLGSEGIDVGALFAPREADVPGS